MATNEVYRNGDHLSWPVKAGATSGEFVLIGDQGLFGVAMTAEGEGGNPAGYATVWTEGVFALPVGTATAADPGDKVYATSAGALTPVETGNTHVGWFHSAKGTTAGEVVNIKLAKV